MSADPAFAAQGFFSPADDWTAPWLRPGLTWKDLSLRQRHLVTGIATRLDGIRAAKEHRKPVKAAKESRRRLQRCRVCEERVGTYTMGDEEHLDEHPDRRGKKCPGSEGLSPAQKAKESREEFERARKAPEQPARRVTLISAAEIAPRRVRWLWKDRVPLGMLTLLAGRESGGKSTIAYERVARVTRGQLDGDMKGAPRDVIVVATEDSWEHVVVPRLMAAGADLGRVFRASVTVQDLGTFELSLPDDVVSLEESIRARDAALVLLDPLISRLSGRLDTHKDADVRVALEPLVGLANRTGATLIGIIHVNKTGTTDPLTAVMGSRAFAAVARAVLFVVRDGDVRLLCFPKSNLGPEQRSISFRIENREVGKDPDGQPINTGAVVLGGEVDRTARDVLEEQAGGRVSTAKDKAVTWLRERLKDGPVLREIVVAEAEALGIAERTLKRAAVAAGVTSETSGFPARATWSLPKVEM